MKLQYTVDAQGVHIQGVDKTNPVIYLNDMVKDTCEMFYLWLKANRKECNLVGNISDHNGHPLARPIESQPELFKIFNQIYTAFKSMGGQNVPVPILGSSKNMVNGQTTWENSPGSDLIISEAKKASPTKPLVLFVGGQVTTVANAYLKDKSIKDNIIVFHTDSWGASNYNCIDSWAPQVLIDNGIKLINWDGDLNSWYEKAGSPNYRGTANDSTANPIKRMPGITFANINNAFHNFYRGNFEHMYNALGAIGDGPPVFWFFNNTVWKNVVKRNKSNQTVTTEDFAFLLISENNWDAYGPQLSSYMNNPANYVAVTAPVPNQPPSVTITSGNSAVPGSVTLTAIASDDQQVAKVEFFVDGVKVGENTDSPYNATWQATIGTYEITAKATDNQGAATTSAPVSVVVADVVIPPPTGDCECDVKAGVTETLSAGSAATVTSRKEGKTHVFDFGIPEGLQGIPGTPGSGTGSGQVQKTYNVLDFGAVGNGSADDTQAFQNAFNQAAIGSGKVIIPSPSSFYKLTNTINVRPVSGQGQVKVSVEAWGGPNRIRYMGASNKAVFYITGIKNCIWTGFGIEVASGLSGVTVIDIDTESELISSCTGTKFDTYRINLGDGQNNVGFRLGHKRVQVKGNDISNILWMNGSIYGNRQPGQVAYLNEGHNTLHLQFLETFTAGCDKFYSNSGPAGRGNGGTVFFGAGGSGNNIDYDINFEQNYTIVGGTWELGKVFLRVPDFAQVSPNIMVQNVSIKNYTDSDGLIQVNVPANLTLQNVYMMQSDRGAYLNPVVVRSSAGVGSLVMINCTLSTNNAMPYQKVAGSWRVTSFGNTRFNTTTGSVVQNKEFFPGEFDVAK